MTEAIPKLITRLLACVTTNRNLYTRQILNLATS